jgi:hypothetical protein
MLCSVLKGYYIYVTATALKAVSFDFLFLASEYVIHAVQYPFRFTVSVYRRDLTMQALGLPSKHSSGRY